MKRSNKVFLAGLIALSFTLTGCGAADRAGAALTGHSTHCVEGVMYIQFLNGASVMYNRDGTIKTCE